MSNYTEIHGIIKVPMYENFDKARKLNERSIHDLEVKGEYPYLTESMFAITPPEVSYMYQIIHFASSMKAIEDDWLQWVGKFEKLLSKMSWSSVTVHLNTEYCGQFEFTWLANDLGKGEVVTSWEYDNNPNIVISS